MITAKEQESLFELISKNLAKDVDAIAIGGTAMMFKGYKNTTKDIDLVFENDTSRNTFIKAIEKLGYRKCSLESIYDKKRKQDVNKPVIYSRGEERFDLFVKNVFGFVLSKENLTQRNDFISENELRLHILSTEILVLLKSITNREKDFEDILLLTQKEEIDWDLVVDLAVEQKKSNSWILIDLEETLQKLKNHLFLKERLFEKIYKNA